MIQNFENRTCRVNVRSESRIEIDCKWVKIDEDFVRSGKLYQAEQELATNYWSRCQMGEIGNDQ